MYLKPLFYKAFRIDQSAIFITYTLMSFKYVLHRFPDYGLRRSLT